MNEALLVLYFFILVILAIFGTHRYYLLYIYLKNRKNIKEPLKQFETLPRVTIQLPFFNEMYVAARLIDHTVKIDYPKELLEIQVLDDSTDETTELAKERVEVYQKQGFDITLMHRTNRQGFKAGALDEGMKEAKGEFIAIFDADFVPPVDFLSQTIHFFTEDKIAMVQTRWGHLNEKFSLITRVQSIFLDGHFVIEHTARNRSGRFFNFNGTAGIWRKQAIDDAGGWEHDTLTEDLDLSYRAQLKGWKFIYLPKYASPAELPVDIVAFKNQQHRWAKGGVQTAKKLIGRIFKSDHTFAVKSESFFHLLGNLSYLLMIPFSVSIFPMVMLRINNGLERLIWLDIPLIILTTASMSAFYITSQRELYSNWPSKIKYLPALMGVGIGLSVNNATAVVEALFNRESEFVRTPKLGVGNKKEKWFKKKYKGKRNHFIPLLELVLGLYFAVVVTISIIEGIWPTLPFLVLFMYGYLYMAFLSYRSMLRKR